MRRSFRRFATTAQHPADRRAQFLVLAVDAAKPTTRPSLPLQQLGLQSLDVLAPRFCFLRPEHPADPFIAGKRGEVFPRSENLWVGNQDASQLHRDCMDESAGDRPQAACNLRAFLPLRKGSRAAGYAQVPTAGCALGDAIWASTGCGMRAESVITVRRYSP